jgi:hypothetical protein
VVENLVLAVYENIVFVFSFANLFLPFSALCILNLMKPRADKSTFLLVVMFFAGRLPKAICYGHAFVVGVGQQDRFLGCGVQQRGCNQVPQCCAVILLYFSPMSAVVSPKGFPLFVPSFAFVNVPVSSSRILLASGVFIVFHDSMLLHFLMTLQSGIIRSRCQPGSPRKGRVIISLFSLSNGAFKTVPMYVFPLLVSGAFLLIANASVKPVR